MNSTPMTSTSKLTKIKRKIRLTQRAFNKILQRKTNFKKVFTTNIPQKAFKQAYLLEKIEIEEFLFYSKISLLFDQNATIDRMDALPHLGKMAVFYFFGQFWLVFIIFCQNYLLFIYTRFLKRSSLFLYYSCRVFSFSGSVCSDSSTKCTLIGGMDWVDGISWSLAASSLIVCRRGGRDSDSVRVNVV